MKGQLKEESKLKELLVKKQREKKNYKKLNEEYKWKM